jgi:hypothetical protein
LTLLGIARSLLQFALDIPLPVEFAAAAWRQQRY